MKPLTVLSIFALMSATSLPGCTDTGVSADTRTPGLYSKVVDANGVPIADVDLHYIFYTASNPTVLDYGIAYGLAMPEPVTLKIFGPLGNEVATLVNGEQQTPGAHVVLFDSSVTNGIYSYQLQAGDSSETGEFYIRDDDTTRLLQKPPLLSSDTNGEFFLGSSVLGIGETFFNEVISDSLSFLLSKPGYRTLEEGFRIDPNKPTDRTFTLLAN